jgi:RimJ/RimL family protein N-acetyltransferase
MSDPKEAAGSCAPRLRFSTAPRLETERLILRAHRVEDFPGCAAMWRDPRIIEFTIGTESPPQRTWQRLLAYCGHWTLLGFGYWALESKSSGRYIGELGFADFHRDFPPSVSGLPEIGWVLAREAHGRGYSTEALSKVLEWGDANLGAERTSCMIHRDNHVSIHLARKFGYSTTVRAANDIEPAMLLTRNAPRVGEG